VSVPASPSLNLTRAMTLSAWVRPSAPQSGWRTIVQRHADAYVLTAGSDPLIIFGRADDLRVMVVAAALAWFCLAIATVPRPSGEVVGSWWLPVGLS
jgi:hypothetical protein